MLRRIVLARRACEISAIGVGVGANGLLKPGPNIEGGIPYVRVLDIKQSRLPAQQSLRTSNEIAEQYRRSTLRSGDILVTIRGTVGRTCVVPDELAGANITQDTAMRNILRSTFAAKKPYSAKSGEDHE
jgi:hypothetical protein